MNWQFIADIAFVVMIAILAAVLGAVLGRLEVYVDEVRGLRRDVREVRQVRQGMDTRNRPGVQGELIPPPPGEPT
jgi:predicted ATP-dependent serine protease